MIMTEPEDAECIAHLMRMSADPSQYTLYRAGRQQNSRKLVIGMISNTPLVFCQL